MSPSTAAHGPQGVFLGPGDRERGISLLPSLHQELSYGEGNPKSGPLKPVHIWKNAESQEGMRWSGGRAGGVWIPALQDLEMGHTGNSRAGYGAADGTLGCQGGG